MSFKYTYLKSEYFGVHGLTNPKTMRTVWRFMFKKKYSPQFKTEREAAIGMDKVLIATGRQPVNILKPKP